MHGSPDYYTSDAQLAAAITELEAVTATLGTNLNSLTDTIRITLETLRKQAMGEAIGLHLSGKGEVGTSNLAIIPAWTGRTAFCVTNTGPTANILYIGGTDKYGMATLEVGEHYQNETYCGVINIKGNAVGTDYAFEEW